MPEKETKAFEAFSELCISLQISHQEDSENRQLQLSAPASNGSQNQKGDSMSSNDRPAKDEQTNQTVYQPPPANSRHAVQPSGPKGDNPATAGPGPTKVQSNTPENRLGHINPSAPEDANTTPGTANEK